MGDPIGLGRDLLQQALADSPAFVAAALSLYALTGTVPDATVASLQDDGPGLWALASGVRKLGAGGKSADKNGGDRKAARASPTPRWTAWFARGSTGLSSWTCRRRGSRARRRGPPRAIAPARWPTWWPTWRASRSRRTWTRRARCGPACWMTAPGGVGRAGCRRSWWRASGWSRIGPRRRCARWGAPARPVCRPIACWPSASSTSTRIIAARPGFATSRRRPPATWLRCPGWPAWTRACPTPSCAPPAARCWIARQQLVKERRCGRARGWRWRTATRRPRWSTRARRWPTWRGPRTPGLPRRPRRRNACPTGGGRPPMRGGCGASGAEAPRCWWWQAACC